MLHIDYSGKLLFETGDLKSKRNPAILTRVDMFEIPDTILRTTQADSL